MHLDASRLQTTALGHQSPNRFPQIPLSSASLTCSLLAMGLDGEGAAEPAWVWQTHCPAGTQLCWPGGRLFSGRELSCVHGVFPSMGTVGVQSHRDSGFLGPPGLSALCKQPWLRVLSVSKGEGTTLVVRDEGVSLFICGSDDFPWKSP